MRKFIVLLVMLSCAQMFAQTSLQAILIVGPQEDGTRGAENEMNTVAATFELNKIKVHKFYNLKADWDSIVKVAKNCSFFVYAGHGSTMGESGSTGGLCLTTMVSTKKMLAELKLKKNAMIIFKSVCRGAGSSASDDKDIGISEAKKRVINYAEPFFKMGAAAYVAINYDQTVPDFLIDFFANKSLKDAFEKVVRSTGTEIEYDAALPTDLTKNVCISSDEGGGETTRITYTNGVKKVEKFISPKTYENAYVGNKLFNFSLLKQGAQ